MCLNTVMKSFSFEEYLDDRARKDSKFVNLVLEDEVQVDEEGQAKEKSGSEFSISDEYDQEEDMEV